MAGKRIYSLNENIFDKINTPETAYWFGFILADGCISKTKNGYNKTIQIKLKADDSHHLEKFNKFVDTNKPLSFITSKSNNKVKVEVKAVQQIISSGKMVDDLLKNGCFYNKSKTLLYPFINKELENHFIRGLLDGDGSLYIVKGKKANHKNNLGINYIGTLSMVSGFKNALSFLNCGNIYQEKRSENCYYFTAVLNEDKSYLLYNYLYGLNYYPYLDRKKDKIIDYLYEGRSTTIITPPEKVMV